MIVSPIYKKIIDNPVVCSSTLKIEGERVVCKCGCNVFSKHLNNTDDDYEVYTCNSCKGVIECK